MGRKRYYSNNSTVNNLKRISDSDDYNVFDRLNRPFITDNEKSNKIFDEWKNNFCDSWQNNVASIGSNNSIMQYSEFIRERLSYAECGNLSIDTIINRAINTIVNECLNKGGYIVVNDDVQNASEITESIEKRLNELNFWNELRAALSKSLIYGGALLYYDFGDSDISKEIFYNFRTFSTETGLKLRGFRAIEPWNIAPYEVDTANPLNYDYMKPLRWYVTGGAVLHSSRADNVVFFDSPDLLKPLFNFLGVSMCQFMKDYVKNADTIRQSLSDIFLRFRSIILKTQLVKNNEQQALIRTKAFAKTNNNLGVLLITENEEVSNLITPISGLDRIQAQAFESMVISSRLPATKLLGISPSGFNSTGEFELSNYYDEISGYQNNIIYPIILKAINTVAWSLGYDLRLDYTFNQLRRPSEMEEANIRNLNADFALKSVEGGLLTQEQGFEWLKNDEVNKINNFELSDDNDSLEGFEGLEGVDYEQKER